MFTAGISRWNPVACGQAGKLLGTADKQCIGSDEERIGTLARKRGKSFVDFNDRTRVKYTDLQAVD
jgi:hypothetical protein